MKAISSIIAIILILMIVVALAALAYTWFTGIFSSLTGTVSTSVGTTTTAMGTSFKIENVINVTCLTCPPTQSYVNATIRNIGTSNINLSKILGYLNEDPIPVVTSCCGGTCSCISTTSGSLIISRGDKATIPFNTTKTGPINCGKTLKITVESGLSDSKKVICP